MDLDMIQDLLGGSHLPPPPSVQDLLGDVVAHVQSSPSPPQSPSYLHLSAEHSYSKGAMDEGAAAEQAEPMELGAAHTSGCQTLAQLSSTSDCYEAFLLNLLRVYTQNKIDSQANPDSASQTSAAVSSPTEANGSGATVIDSIFPEAINSLSHGQVQSLVTSNSTNYDVIHQILAYRQKSEGGGCGASEEKTGSESGEGGSTLQQLQALQLTPDQLKQIQLQMEELIRTKQIVLPADLSVEQQQQLLQSLILKHVHSQHQQFVGSPATTQQTAPTATQPSSTYSPNTSCTSSTNTIPKSGVSSPSKVTVGNTLAAILRGDSQEQAGVPGSGGGGGKAVKMEVPPVSSVEGGSGVKTVTVALQLSSNPVREGGSSPTTTPTAAPATTVPAGVTTRSGGRKKKDSKHQDEPKKPSSPYGVFFSDVYPSVLQANPRMSFSEASKLISAMWNAMGIDTKKQYHERSEKQKEVYQTYQASRKTETTPTDEPAAATSPQVTTETKTLVEVTPPTQQTASYADLTTGAEQVVGGTAVSQRQSVAPPLVTSPPPPPPPPPPAPPATKVVMKESRHCVNDGCFKDAVYTDYRGPRYCSNECVVQHCKSVFQEWVAQRKVAT